MQCSPTIDVIWWGDALLKLEHTQAFLKDHGVKDVTVAGADLLGEHSNYLMLCGRCVVVWKLTTMCTVKLECVHR